MAEYQIPSNSVVQTMTIEAMRPLYNYADRIGSAMVNTGIAALQTGKIVTPQQATTPWNAVTQQSLLQLQDTTHQRFYSEYVTRAILTEVLPLQEGDPNSNEIIWFETRFGAEVMDEVAELAMGREIGFERVAQAERYKNFAIGYSFSEDFLKTPGSLKQIAETIMHLIIVQLDTACATAVHALLNAPDRFRDQHKAQHTNFPHTLRDIMSDEVDLFDILHQDKGMTTLRDRLIRIFGAQKGTFRFLLFSQEIYQQAQATDSQSEYYRAGPAAPIARNAGSTPMSEGVEPLIPQWSMYNPKQILIKPSYTTALVPRNGLHLMQQIVQIGEFYRMLPKHNGRYEPDPRVNNIKNYDGHNDRYHEIEYMEAIDHANVFNHGNNGLPYSIHDAPYSPNNGTVRGAIKDVIWDENGIARSYIGNIPKEYHGGNHSHNFGASLANLLERRRVLSPELVKQFVDMQSEMFSVISKPLAVTDVSDSGRFSSLLTSIPLYDLNTRQGVSWDEQERDTKNAVQTIVQVLQTFFPSNIFLDASHAPHYVQDRTAAASFWENVVIPYYPPVVLLEDRKGGSGILKETAQSIRTMLDLPDDITLAEFKVFAKAWALGSITSKADPANKYNRLVYGGKDADVIRGRGASKKRNFDVASRRRALAAWDYQLQNKINRLSMEDKSRFEVVYQIVTAYENTQRGGSYDAASPIVGYTTARATPNVVRQLLGGTFRFGTHVAWVADPDVTVLPITKQRLNAMINDPLLAHNPFNPNARNDVPYNAAVANDVTRRAMEQTDGGDSLRRERFEEEEARVRRADTAGGDDDLSRLFGTRGSFPVSNLKQKLAYPIHPDSFLNKILDRSKHLIADLHRNINASRYVVDPSSKLGVVEMTSPTFVSNWQHARNGTGLEQLFNTLRLGERITYQAFRHWSHEGLPPPVGIMIVRPTITLTTANFIACEGGPAFGGVYYKASSVGSGDHPRGLHQTQVRAQMAGSVRQPNNVHVQLNVLITKVQRGHGCRWFTPSQFLAGPNTWTSNSETSMLAFIIPTTCDQSTMISLTGQDRDPGVHNYMDYKMDRGGHWIGSDRANAMYNFIGIAKRRKRNNDKLFDQNNINVLCFEGQSYGFNQSRQEFSEMTPGSGHLKNTDTIGAKLTRNLVSSNYPKNREHV